MNNTGGHDFKVYVIKIVHINVSDFGWLQSYYPLETLNSDVTIIETKWSKIINKHNT